MKIIPGIVSATFRQLSVGNMISLCRQAGLQAIEWSENVHIKPDDPIWAAGLKRQTEEAGLQIAAYGSYYRLGKQRDHGEIFLKSLVSAKALGAPLIRVWAGSQPSIEVGEEEMEVLSEEASMIAGMAAAEGIKIALEWHKNTLTDTNESAMGFLRLADHPNLYCLWQPTAALTVEQRLLGLELLGDRLLNLHIYYWEQGVRRPLEEGRELWLQYLKHTDQTRCRYGLLEFVMGDTTEQFLEDASILHQLIKESGRES